MMEAMTLRFSVARSGSFFIHHTCLPTHCPSSRDLQSRAGCSGCSPMSQTRHEYTHRLSLGPSGGPPAMSCFIAQIAGNYSSSSLFPLSHVSPLHFPSSFSISMAGLKRATSTNHAMQILSCVSSHNPNL